MYNTVVFDTSVVVRIVTSESGGEAAADIFDNTDHKIAPILLKAELCNALYKKAKNGILSFADAERIYDIFLHSTKIEFIESDRLYRNALTLCAEIKHNSIYDCLFLALAIENNCKLCTADDAFVKKADGYSGNLLSLQST